MKIGILGPSKPKDWYKLMNIKKKDYLEKIKHIAKDQGDGSGFDILSFDLNGNKKYIEVKTTKSNLNSTFFVTNSSGEITNPQSALPVWKVTILIPRSIANSMHSIYCLLDSARQP